MLRTTITLPVLLVGFVFPLQAADDAHAPAPPKTVARPDRDGYIKGELIYPLDDKPTPQCHASTIVETPSGLVAAWFGGTREGHRDVGIWVSQHHGNKPHNNGTWSRPVEVATGEEGEQRDYPCWNPVLFQPRKGPLLLFYKVGPSPRRWWGMLMTSRDGGKTWSKPRRLGRDKRLGKENPNLIGPVKNKPVQLKDGGILCPSSTEHDGWRVHFELTADLGKSWTVIGPIRSGEQSGEQIGEQSAKQFSAIQPTILTYPTGKLQALCRTRQGVIAQTRSSDGGKSWSRLSATPLPNPNAGIDAVTLNDGRQLLVYNHTTRGGGFPSGRQMLNVAVSRDGKTWTPVLTLQRSRGEYSYPAVIQTSDGRVHVTYTYKRRSVKHVVLDPQKLTR